MKMKEFGPRGRVPAAFSPLASANSCMDVTDIVQTVRLQSPARAYSHGAIFCLRLRFILLHGRDRVEVYISVQIGFSQIDKIGNIGIRGFTTWKKSSDKMLPPVRIEPLA